jgi:hypothetical protein
MFYPQRHGTAAYAAGSDLAGRHEYRERVGEALPQLPRCHTRRVGGDVLLGLGLELPATVGGRQFRPPTPLAEHERQRSRESSAQAQPECVGSLVVHPRAEPAPHRRVRHRSDSQRVPHRVLRSAIREAYSVARALTPTHRRLRDHLVAIATATIGVNLICAAIAFLAERHTPETDIKTRGSALFWTTTQLLTVSSSIKNPVSTTGRVLDVFMEIWAITVIATLAGAMGSFFQKRGEELGDKRTRRADGP